MTAPVPDPIYIFRKDEETFHSLVFVSTDTGNILATGSQSGNLHCWDLASNRTTHPPLPTGDQPCIALRHIADTLVAQNKAGVATFYRLAADRWKRVGEIEMDYVGFCQIAVGFVGGRAVIACPEQRAGLRVYAVGDRSKLHAFVPDERTRFGEIMACRVVETAVVAVYENGEMLAWDWSTGTATRRLKLTDDTPMTMGFDASRSLGVVGTSGNKLTVFKLDDREASVRHVFATRSEGVSAVRFRPDGKVFAAGCWDGKVRVFATRTCRQLAVLEFHADAVLDVAFSDWTAGGRSLLGAAAKDGKVSLWDVC